MTDLIKRDTIVEICARRNAAVAAYDKFFDLLEAAHAKVIEAQALITGCGIEFSWPYSRNHSEEIEEFQQAIKLPQANYREIARRLTDIQVWGALIARTKLETLMDKKGKDDLRKQMAYISPKVCKHTGQIINAKEIARGLPPVSEETVLATIEGLAAQSGDIWKRGIANAFSALDKRFKTHDGFKVGKRVIISNAFGPWGAWNSYTNHQDTITDVERIFLVLDGKTPRATYAGIVGVIGAERGGCPMRAKQSRHKGDYFEVRIFQNGNAHLWFTRPDLVEQVNKLLAEYYGAALGWGKAPQGDPKDVFAGAVERSPAKGFGLYPTPDGLADRVIRRAFVEGDRPLSVLEPSAGTGKLASRAANPNLWATNHVTVVEIQPHLVEQLRSSGKYERVLCRDFLKMQSADVGKFDRVVMNPPFDRGRDIDHVNHALGFLVKGGILVSIMSAAAELSLSNKAVAFREKIDSDDLSSRFYEIEEGSFRELGTNVNTTIVVIKRSRR